MGPNEDVLETTKKGLEKFTYVLYGSTRVHNVNTVRYLKATKRFC